MTTQSLNMPGLLALAALSLAGCTTQGAADIEAGAASPPHVSIAKTCDALKRFLAISREDLEEARGDLISVDPSPGMGVPGGKTYVSSLQTPGWSDCTIFSYDEAADDDPYVDHTLYCLSLELKSDRAARAYVADVYRCTEKVFSERTRTEAWFEGGYDMIAFDGEVTPGGREAPVDFGSTDYARLTVETSYAGSEDVDVTINYQFLKAPVPRGSGDAEERIILR